MEANLEELKMQVANLIARVSMAEAQIAEMDDDMPEQESSITQEQQSTSPIFEYSSYFKLYDASTTGHCNIGVKDGGNPTSDYCGSVYVNGEGAQVPYYVSGDLSVGDYYVWLHSWMALTDDSPYWAGANGIVVVTSTSTEPTSPSGVGWSNQLLGRFSVTQEEGADPVIGPINQDYLRGGEHHCMIVGDCEGEAP